METALIKGILSGLTIMGVPSYLLFILAKINLIAFLNNWQLWVLFVLSVLMLSARIVVYCIKSWQDIRWREKFLRKRD